VDPHLDRPDLAERLRPGRYRLVDGPDHVRAPDEAPFPGYYRAAFGRENGERIDRFLTDAGYGAVLRRRGDDDPTLSADELEEWSVVPDLTALEARYNAEAGQGA
jgi:hypothetical protein